MKHNLLKLGTLAIALVTASLFAQDLEKIQPPPLPTPLDARTSAARRAIILSRAANAEVVTNGLAQGAPGLNNGVDSGGRTNAPQPGRVVGQAPTVSPPAVVETAPSVKTPPSIGIPPVPAATPGIK